MNITTQEQWRVERIKKAVRLASKILDMDEAQLKTLLHSVNDHMGRLQVFWKHPMSNSQARAFKVAWGMCGEAEESVDNRVHG